MDPYTDIISSKYKTDKPKKKKIYDADFKIPKYSQFKWIMQFNYRVTQLKKICKFYKIKQSGNKPELLKNIYNHLYLSSKIIPIQNIYRKHLIQQYCKYSGIGLLKRSCCVNDTDILTLDDISNISFPQFFSFTDKDDNHTYGFDIKSILNWINKANSKKTNPYNRKTISLDVLDNIKQKIRLSKILKIPIELKIENNTINNQDLSYEDRVINVFQYIDDLGNYTNPDWFLSLNRYQKTRFIRELYDIWFYRLGLTPEVRQNICPRGNPFRRFALNIQIDIIAVSENTLNKFILSVIEEFVYYGVTDEYRSLGAAHILTALTLINPDAAFALPWLYQSVMT
tara:strand:+ start:4019 stop:5041 length:1023 start_codon:yes stop_codon:yes gene_type:complete